MYSFNGKNTSKLNIYIFKILALILLCVWITKNTHAYGCNNAFYLKKQVDMQFNFLYLKTTSICLFKLYMFWIFK